MTSLVQPLQLKAQDLGIAVCLDEWMIDSYCTRVRFHLEGNLEPYTVAGGVLTPYYVPPPLPDQEEKPQPVALQQMVLARVDPDEIYSGSAWMVFLGYLPHEATHVLLQATRLQIAAHANQPDIYRNRFLDPFDMTAYAELAERMEKNSGDKRGHDYELPPDWECKGKWSFTLALTDFPPDCQVPMRFMAQVGIYGLYVDWIDRGANGTLLAVDCIPHEYMVAGDQWKEAAVEMLEGSGKPQEDLLAKPPLFKFCLLGGSDVYNPVRNGPHGLLQTRNYLEFPALHSNLVPKLMVEEVRGAVLPAPLEHSFYPRFFEATSEFRIPLDVVGCNGLVVFLITNVHEDGTFFLIEYKMAIDSPDIGAIRLQEITLWEPNGENWHLCLGDGVHRFGSGVTEEFRYGLLFPTVPSYKQLTLKVAALDLVLKTPISVPIGA